MRHFKTGSPLARLVALVVTASLLAPMLAGCGGQPAQETAPSQQMAPPPNAQQRPAAQPQRQGLSTKQKLVILAGAAALYYLWKKRQNATQNGPNGKYFLSESTGRIYYRDLKTGKFQWDSPPQQQIRVPENEAQQYNLDQYQGYNGSRQGQEFGGYGYNNVNPRYDDAEPAQVPAGMY